MGMSAGQARLLSITQRINDNERRAQSISDAKMRLSDATTEIGNTYIKALNRNQLKFSTYDSDGNKTTQKLTGALLTQYGELKNQYVIVNAAGQAMVSESDSANYKNSKNLEEFLTNYNVDNSGEKTWYTNLWYRMNGDKDDKTSTSEQSWTTLSDSDMNSSKWIQYALESGIVTLEQVKYANSSTNEINDKGEWTSVIYTSALDITEESDDTDLAKAEAEYNAALQNLESKDKQYDNELKNLDTEHSALQSEYESVQTTIQKNVERSFKAFS